MLVILDMIVKFTYNMTIMIFCEVSVVAFFQESIHPSAELRSRYSEISRRCREDGEAAIITVNGRGDTVSLGYEQYMLLRAKLELLEMLDRTEDDVLSERVAPMEDTFSRIRSALRDDG